jgi:hypothetical protein
MTEELKEQVFDKEDVPQQQTEEQQIQQEPQQQQSLPTQELSDIDKIKELERLYMQKLQELANREKELEPLMQLQDYLSKNPEKVQDIASILQGTKPSGEEELLGIEAEPNEDIKKELQRVNAELEKMAVEKEEKYLLDKIEEFKKKYEYFDEDKFFARLFAYPDGYLDRLSQAEYDKLLESVAQLVNYRNKLELDNRLKSYLEKKKEIAEKTKSETAPSISGVEKQQIKITMDNAKEIAKKLLEKYSK